MEWMLLPLKRYAEFSGRSRRMEFWMWVLFSVIVSIVLNVIDGILGFSTSRSATTVSSTGAAFSTVRNIGILGGLWTLATLIPSLAVGVRRLHDTDRSGWWILLPAGPYLLGIILVVMGAVSGSLAMVGLGGVLSLIGLICGIVLIVFYCLPGTPGPNRFGPDPLGGAGNLGETFS